MRNRFRTGDVVTVLSPNADIAYKSFTIGAISDTVQNTVTDDAKYVQRIYAIDCPYALEQGDILLI